MIVQRQKLFFQSALSGEYFTGEDLQKEAENVRADLRNGSIKYADSGKPATEKISRANSLRRAYINKNIYGPRVEGKSNAFRAIPGETLEKTKNALSKLKKKGLINYDKPYMRPDGYVQTSYEVKSAPSKLMRKLSKLSKKFKIG